MPIHLYQSQKVKRYIGESVYIDEPWKEDHIDLLTIWYVDVFFVNRERYLVFTNPLTKLTFFIFRYSKKSHPDLIATFRNKLQTTLNAANINPQKYLKNCDLLIPFRSTNRSASAHLSRIKDEYKWMIETNHDGVSASEDETFYNDLIARDLTTYGGKDYDRPAQRFYHELLIRRWD